MKRLVWDWFVYAAIVSIVVWVLLKGFGVFNILLFLDIYPYLAVSYVFGWQAKLNYVANEVNGLKKFRYETIKNS